MLLFQINILLLQRVEVEVLVRIITIMKRMEIVVKLYPFVLVFKLLKIQLKLLRYLFKQTLTKFKNFSRNMNKKINF